MKKYIYRKLSAILFKLNRQLQHFQPPESKAKQLLDSRQNALQLQAMLLRQYGGMEEKEFREWPPYSWMGKDGIDGWILYLLSHGGMGNRTCVDFGAATGVDGNTFNLVINHGFKGFMVDGNEEAINYGKQVYTAMRISEPTMIPSMLNRENVISLCKQHEIPSSPEVMSLDIDSIDWYVLEACTLTPSILVLEFNNLWGPEESYSVPYSPEFKRELGAFLYGGASLQAFFRLLIPRGYKLVAIASSGFDAIFVQDNARFSFISSITPKEGFANSPVWQKLYNASLKADIRNKAWVPIG